MKALVDTSVIVRYLVDEPAAQAARAAEILDGPDDLGITGLAVVETAYVLTSVYGVPRDVVVDHLIALVQKENMIPVGLSKSVLLEALMLCRPSARLSFTDAVLWATARHERISRVATFDRRFPADSIEILA